MTIAAIVLYWVGAIADFYTTKTGLLNRGTRFKEGNKIAAWIMDTVGGKRTAMTIVKVGVFVGLMLWWPVDGGRYEFMLGFGILQLIVGYLNYRKVKR